MYPKPINDLQGWLVKDLACGNTSTIVIADESVITWGPAPTYGELGYGDPAEGNQPKSSTVAKLVDNLQKAGVFTVAMGYGHGIAITNQDSSEEAKKIVDGLEEWEVKGLVRTATLHHHMKYSHSRICQLNKLANATLEQGKRGASEAAADEGAKKRKK